MKTFKTLLIVLVGLLTFNSASAQSSSSSSSLSVGADFASRYVWRGVEYSDSPAIQPYIEYSSGNFTLGAWASYETGGQVVGQEFDIYASYTIGAFSLGFTDYSFPVDIASDGYFEMKNHIGEATFSFNGISSFPVSLMVGTNIYNDSSDSVYAELGIPFKSVGGTSVSAFIGGGNGLYSTDSDFSLVNIGLSASKNIKVTDTFTVGASASAIFNPDTDDAYLVFILSL